MASTAMEGLERLAQDRFDLVIVDYKMPGLSGIDFMNKFKERGIDTPVIMATGAGDEKIAVEVMRAGAYDYVIKDEAFRGAMSLVVKRTLERYEVKKERERLEAQTREYAEKLKKANEELRKISQMKSHFVSVVSHELRTPLSIIKEGVSLVLDGIPGKINEKQNKILKTAGASIDRLTRIIDGLLDISKIEAHKVELKRGLVNITDLVKEACAPFKAQAKERGLELKLNLPRQRLDVYADADKITQVFTNLIGNALKFTKKGYIEISAKQLENGVECAVSDTGIGISQDNAPKLFKKFEQFGRVAGAGEKGTGLGLSIAKGIVQMHGGKIWVQSQLDKGTKISFILPKGLRKDQPTGRRR